VSAFGVLDEYIEIAVVVEYAGVEQFELRLVLATSSVLFQQLTVREFRLRIFVEVLHIGVHRCRVEVEVVLLYILAVIPSFSVNPKIRSLRMGSCSFHKTKAKQIVCFRSLIPARPSSFQR
jgi:hypothetical protein